MRKIIAFGASNSQHSINKQLATYAANELEGVAHEIIDLNDFPLPLYGIDLQKATGIPENAVAFSKLIEASDGLIISLAEHNSNYTVAFKNLTDWVSRLEGPVWKGKPVFLLSTSNGKRGGMNVMEIARKYMPFAGARIAAHFSLPEFKIHFSPEAGIINPELREAFLQQLTQFKEVLLTESTEIEATRIG